MTSTLSRLPSLLLTSGALLMASALGCSSDPTPTPTPADVPASDGSSDASTDAGDVTEQAPPLRNRLDLADDALADQALAILQAPQAEGTPSCVQCHGVTRQTVRHWRALTDTSLSTCITDLAVATPASAQTMIRCLRGGSDSGNFQPDRLGILATAAKLPWFQYLFRRAGVTNPTAAHGEFADRVVQPPSPSATLTQAQFDILGEWFARGLPGLDDRLLDDPRPTECTPGISADVAAHVRSMSTRGWAALNRERNLLMHGCTGATRPSECFASAPSVSTTTYGAMWNAVTGAQMREIFTTDYSSAYWTRSSADGRFVAHGARTAAPAGRFIDLQSNRVIPANGNYDPAFFPDNSGFVFHGTAPYVCAQSVLSTGMLSRLTFTEAGCSRAGAVGLYEHAAASLDGSDYFVIDTQFESDDGGHSATLRDPRAPFTVSSSANVVLMSNNGAGFTQRTNVAVELPYEGDLIVSPSGGVVLTRVSGTGSTQLGYVLRRVDVTRNGEEYNIAMPEIARYCVTGSKANISYDERWALIHHYVGRDDAQEMGFTGPDDPAFAPYLTRGAANAYLIDLLTGRKTRLTNMQPGQYALYPHFRADGWIYITVRTAGASPEHIVATDAAIVLAAR